MAEPPTEVERELLKKFRELMKDELDEVKLADDIYLVRWLRARNLDLDKACLMLRNSLKWRKENNVDNVLNEPINKALLDIVEGHFSAFDRHGRPVIAAPNGDWDIRPLLDEGKKEDLIRFMIQGLEIFQETLRMLYEHRFPFPTSVPLTKFTVIADLQHFTYAKFIHKKTIDALLEAVKIYEANYPETLGRCIVINSPRVFAALFSMIKPFLSEQTVSKISIFGPNDKSWKKEVESFIDVRELPIQYGGILPCSSQAPF